MENQTPTSTTTPTSNREAQLNELYLYSLKEIESVTGVKKQMLRLYIKNGRLAAFKIGREYKISKAAMEQFIKDEQDKYRAKQEAKNKANAK